MNFLLASVFTLYGLAILWLLVLLYRNNKVNKVRTEMLDKLDVLGRNDILRCAEEGTLMMVQDPWKWRYDMFESVSYKTMVYTIWKPITAEAFYPNTLFLEE